MFIIILLDVLYVFVLFACIRIVRSDMKAVPLKMIAVGCLPFNRISQPGILLFECCFSCLMGLVCTFLSCLCFSSFAELNLLIWKGLCVKHFCLLNYCYSNENSYNTSRILLFRVDYSALFLEAPQLCKNVRSMRLLFKG